MKNTKRATIPYRRKGEGKTNYRKRLKLLKSHTPRLVVRKSLTSIYAQVVAFGPDGDRVLVTATPRDLVKEGWQYSTKNMPAAHLIGLMTGKKARKANITSVIADLGLQKPVKKSVLYTVIKGVKDAGVHLPVSDEVLPDEKRIKGEHIIEYWKKVGGSTAYQKQFSAYLRKGLKPEEMTKKYEEIKARLLQW